MSQITITVPLQLAPEFTTNQNQLIVGISDDSVAEPPPPPYELFKVSVVIKFLV